LHQLLQAVLTLIQIGVMTEAGKPAGVVVARLVWVYLPGVQVKHLRPAATARGVIEQIAENRVGELAKIAPGTLVNLAAGGGDRNSVTFGHPSGTLQVGAEAKEVNGQWTATKAIMSRSARVLMKGWVRMPDEA
jgi:2-methylaconitate cis-trans-isomerase PrpF